MSGGAFMGPGGGERSPDRPGAAGGSRSPGEARVDDDAPGVPGLRSWRAVYVLVLAVFVGIVIALAVLTRAYA